MKVLISFSLYILEEKNQFCRETDSVTKRQLNYCLSALQHTSWKHRIFLSKAAVESGLSNYSQVARTIGVIVPK